MEENTNKNSPLSDKDTKPAPKPQIEQDYPEPIPIVKQPSGELREDISRKDSIQVGTPNNTDK